MKRRKQIIWWVVVSTIFCWMTVCAGMFFITEYVPIGIRLPTGWTDPYYPLRCRELESKTYNNLSYFVERGFPFRSAKIADEALDGITIFEYCDDRPPDDHSHDITISSNRLATLLNIVLFFAPALIAGFLFVCMYRHAIVQTIKRQL